MITPLRIVLLLAATALVVTAAAAVTQEFYVTSMILGLVLTAGTVWVMVRYALPAPTGALVFLYDTRIATIRMARRISDA